MIVIGANLAVDRTLALDRLHPLVPGTVIRPRTAVATAGGKAVNVCRASRAHGVRPRLVANLPGALGALVGDWLEAEGHDVHRVATSGEIRSAVVIREAGGRTTVLNEPGPTLAPDDRERFLAAVEEDLHGHHPGGVPHRVLVASGSLPPGPHTEGMYAELVRRTHAAGLRIVLDAARADLESALPAGPDVVTPNLSEALAVLTGATSGESVEPDLPELRAVARDAAGRLCARGARAALVTVGRHGVAGAVRADGDETFWVEAPDVVQVNPIGAGDSFAAGLAVGLERGLSVREATPLAVVTGAASVAHELAGGVDAEVLAELLQRVGAVA